LSRCSPETFTLMPSRHADMRLAMALKSIEKSVFQGNEKAAFSAGIRAKIC
jgi:hypothetical protein